MASIGRTAVYLLSILAIMILTTGASTHAQPPQTVVWAVADRPTSYILEGDNKGRGAVDEVYALLQASLPEYTHIFEKMNFPRVLEKMRRGECVCSVGFRNAEREEVALFSHPAVLALPYGVVSLKGRLDGFKRSTTSLSLVQLIENKKFLGGILQNRSYGEISSLVEKYNNKGTLKELPPGCNLIQMLLLKRIDYLIEIPSFSVYQATQMGVEDRIETTSIDEYSAPALVAHVFCTRNEWGKEFIQKINKVLERERNTETYREIIERWYDDNGKQVIRNNYDRLMRMPR